MSQDAQVAQLCSIIPMLNMTIQRQNAIIDKLVESLNYKNNESEKLDTILAEIKSIKSTPETKLAINDTTNTTANPIIATAVNKPATDNKVAVMTKEELLVANTNLKIDSDTLDKMAGYIDYLCYIYDTEADKLYYSVYIKDPDNIIEIARVFNLIEDKSSYWNPRSYDDIFKHRISLFTVPYEWVETYFPNNKFKLDVTFSICQFISKFVDKVELEQDNVIMTLQQNNTYERVFRVFAGSRSVNYDNGIIKLPIQQYAEYLKYAK